MRGVAGSFSGGPGAGANSVTGLAQLRGLRSLEIYDTGEEIQIPDPDPDINSVGRWLGCLILIPLLHDKLHCATLSTRPWPIFRPYFSPYFSPPPLRLPGGSIRLTQALMQAFASWWPQLSSLYFEGVVSGQGLMAGGGGGGSTHHCGGRAAAPHIMPPPHCLPQLQQLALINTNATGPFRCGDPDPDLDLCISACLQQLALIKANATGSSRWLLASG